MGCQYTCLVVDNAPRCQCPIGYTKSNETHCQGMCSPRMSRQGKIYKDFGVKVYYCMAVLLASLGLSS